MVAFKRKRIIGQGKMAMRAMAHMDEVPEFHMYGKNVDIKEAPARLLISPEIHEIAQLGNDVGDGYWAPTEGNAKLALIQLLTMARMRPDGIWAGD